MTILASDKISDLKGIGCEWLMDKDGNIRLEFWDGFIIRMAPKGSLDDTVSS